MKSINGMIDFMLPQFTIRRNFDFNVHILKNNLDSDYDVIMEG